MSNTEWQEIYVIFKKALTDGTRQAGPLMRRRRPDRSWEYRRMTDDEYLDYMSTNWW